MLLMHNNVHLQNNNNVWASFESQPNEAKKAPQVCNQPNSYLQKWETKLMEDNLLLNTQIQSARDLLTKKTQAFENYENGATRWQRLCVVCHTAGHNKSKCSNSPCRGIAFCNNCDKHLEVKAQIQDLYKVLKELEKKN